MGLDESFSADLDVREWIRFLADAEKIGTGGTAGRGAGALDSEELVAVAHLVMSLPSLHASCRGSEQLVGADSDEGSGDVSVTGAFEPVK